MPGRKTVQNTAHAAPPNYLGIRLRFLVSSFIFTYIGHAVTNGIVRDVRVLRLQFAGGDFMFRLFKVLVVVASLTVCVSAAEMSWDGGDGDWVDANWNGGMRPEQVVERNDGTRGSEDTIIISGGGNVLYDADEVGSDFNMRQGNTLIIGEGSSWTQLTTAEWAENRWTELDMSELILDNGSFNRIGNKPGEGGGALIFGSWRGDDNFDILPPPQEINIDLRNGGSIMNEGQMWFGSWEDHPSGLVVNMTIGDGTIDLTGGDVGIGGPADGDLGLFYGFDDSVGDWKNENYSINFVGPGSITVDATGIIMPFQNDDGEWTNLAPVSYEDMWTAGVLKANGMTSDDGADFSEYFRTEGQLGLDDYRLISMVGGNEGVLGDITGDGRVDASDLNVIGLNWQMADRTPEQGDLTGDGIVNAADLNILGLNWQTGAEAAAAAVPEPSSISLLLSTFVGLCLLRRRPTRQGPC